MTERITIEVWQDGLCVASVNARPDDVRREAQHYALIYSQDGPVRIIGKSGRRRWTIADVERTKVSSQASGHDRVEPMPELTNAEHAVLRQLVSGREVTTIPERLVELGFVRSEKLRSTIGMVKMVWMPTKSARIFIARSEE